MTERFQLIKKTTQNPSKVILDTADNSECTIEEAIIKILNMLDAMNKSAGKSILK